MTDRARGLDVSEVQASIDFRAVRFAGFDFVHVKCTEGARYVDPRFLANVTNARAAGLLVGAYHFLTPQAPVSDQLASFLRAIAPVGIDLPPVIDFEFPSPEHWADGGRGLAPRCLEFARGVRYACGVAPLIYEYPYFDNQLPNSSEMNDLVAECDLWIASYKNEKREPTIEDQPLIPRHWATKTWRFWQWSGNGSLRVPGVPGIVDHDLYNGSLVDLHAWLGTIDNPYMSR